MKRRSWIFFVAAGAVAALAITLLFSREREPVYQGKTLSDWLFASMGTAGPPVQPGSAQAVEAVRNIGTNGFPFLLRWIRHTGPPPWKLILYHRLRPWAAVAFGQSAYREFLLRHMFQNALALRGFAILGRDARPAIPELVGIANARNVVSAVNAINALRYLGQEALQPLLAIATNTFDPYRRYWAVVALGDMHDLGTNSSPAMPVLIQCLKEPELAPAAAGALGTLGFTNDTSVHALIQCAQSGNYDARCAAVQTLGTFGEQARAAVPVLMRILDEPEVDVTNRGSTTSMPDGALHESVTNALFKISPEALSNQAPK